jgi:hypothetical protein
MYQFEYAVMIALYHYRLESNKKETYRCTKKQIKKIIKLAKKYVLDTLDNVTLKNIISKKKSHNRLNSNDIKIYDCEFDGTEKDYCDYVNNDYVNNDYVNNDYVNNDYVNNDYETYKTYSETENNSTDKKGGYVHMFSNVYVNHYVENKKKYNHLQIILQNKDNFKSKNTSNDKNVMNYNKKDDIKEIDYWNL